MRSSNENRLQGVVSESLRLSMEKWEPITQGLTEVGVRVGVDKRFFEILLNYNLHAIIFFETQVRSSITI